jgi:hypothetical protein
MSPSPLLLLLRLSEPSAAGARVMGGGSVGPPSLCINNKKLNRVGSLEGGSRELTRFQGRKTATLREGRWVAGAWGLPHYIVHHT